MNTISTHTQTHKTHLEVDDGGDGDALLDVFGSRVELFAKGHDVHTTLPPVSAPTTRQLLLVLNSVPGRELDPEGALVQRWQRKCTCGYVQPL
jgi:hypothetical protein